VPHPRSVVVVTFPRIQLLDLAGPVEVLDLAGRLDESDPPTAPRPYHLTITSPDGAPIRSTSGVQITPDRSLPDALADAEAAGHLDTLLVVGGDGTRQAIVDEPFLDLVRRGSALAQRTVSVCSGALILAAAGLLDGRRATTHWSVCDLLARTGTDIDVEPDRIHVRDGDVWTSAGVTAGIDLSLALVEHDLGVETAHRIAAHLVVFARRSGGQDQFSAHLRAAPAQTLGIADVQRWLPDHLTADLSVDRLAERAAMSPRTFARTFRAETGTTPAAHVEALRVEAACHLLASTDLTVPEVAARCGFPRAETFHRAFARVAGTTPARYRFHFRRT
jgi:transcriptional regulator GlxA family with amidase domain